MFTDDVRVHPTGSGGPFSISERRQGPPSRGARKGRECFAYRNAIPLLFKGEERFRGLTLHEVMVLGGLLRRARSEFEGRCWPTHAQLVDDLHGTISVRHLTRVVASLRTKGWVVITTVHSNQLLPSGAPVRGGERNVYAVDLARILGVAAEGAQDGQEVHPRDANGAMGDDEIAENAPLVGSDAGDQDLNKHTDPQRDAAPEECTKMVDHVITVDDDRAAELDDTPPTDSMETSALMVVAYWAQTAFPEFADEVGHDAVAGGPEGRGRVARVLGLLQRGYRPDTLKDAVLGATLDDYVSGAGYPLGLVFGEKLLHYARRGARHREARALAVAREERARVRATQPVERSRPSPPERISPDQMNADISRLFRGGAPMPRRALGTPLGT